MTMVNFFLLAKLLSKMNWFFICNHIFELNDLFLAGFNHLFYLLKLKYFLKFLPDCAILLQIIMTINFHSTNFIIYTFLYYDSNTCKDQYTDQE